MFAYLYVKIIFLGVDYFLGVRKSEMLNRIAPKKYSIFFNLFIMESNAYLQSYNHK
jgi:hypothetical protein